MMLYKKEFIMTQNGGVLLRNPAPAVSYVEEKIDELLKTIGDHDGQRNIKCRIFSEFREIYEYDLENAVFPEPFGTFASQEEKEKFVRQKLLYEDFQRYLGDIFLNYHFRLAKSKKIPMIDALPFVIDYNELYDTAMAEYIRVFLGIPYPLQLRRVDETKPEYFIVDYRGMEISLPTGCVKRQVHACAATFILPSLIEHNLLLYLENTVISKWLMEMKGKSLDFNDGKLYQQFLDMKKTGHGILNGDKKTTMEQIWKMGVKYGAFSDDRSMREILCGRKGGSNTLGSILKSTYGRSHIRPEYLQILDYMFDKELLNLRNSIAHGISTTYDYLSLAFVGVMVQIIWDIASNDVMVKAEEIP